MKLVISHPFDFAPCPGSNGDSITPLESRVRGTEEEGTPSSCRNNRVSSFNFKKFMARLSQKKSTCDPPFRILSEPVELMVRQESESGIL
jgi:hypothetical protein